MKGTTTVWVVFSIGRNPAPVDRYLIPWFAGFHTFLVVQDFSHQQYQHLLYHHTIAMETNINDMAHQSSLNYQFDGVNVGGDTPLSSESPSDLGKCYLDRIYPHFPPKTKTSHFFDSNPNGTNIQCCSLRRHGLVIRQVRLRRICEEPWPSKNPPGKLFDRSAKWAHPPRRRTPSTPFKNKGPLGSRFIIYVFL